MKIEEKRNGLPAGEFLKIRPEESRGTSRADGLARGDPLGFRIQSFILYVPTISAWNIDLLRGCSDLGNR